MNKGISVIVFQDGGVRLDRDTTEENHKAIVQILKPTGIFTDAFYPALTEE